VSVEHPLPPPEIENLLAESRLFPPDPAFAAQANATEDLYAEAEADFDEIIRIHIEDELGGAIPARTS